jgi:hypothetical protein
MMRQIIFAIDSTMSADSLYNSLSSYLAASIGRQLRLLQKEKRGTSATRLALWTRLVYVQ